MAFPNTSDTVNSSLVNVTNALSNNFDLIDAALSGLTDLAAVTTPSISPDTAGIEWVNESGLYKYRDDALTWQDPPEETWGSWQTLNMTAPYVARSGFVPAIRISNLKNVELRGQILAGAANPQWPDTGYQLVHSGQFQTILPELTEVFPIGAQTMTTAGQWAHGQCYITTIGSPLTLAIYMLPSGTRNTAGSNNFLCLDNVRFKAA